MPIASEITAVVGPNAAGKTALLHALSKLFGVSRAQRTVQRSDFHLGADDDPEDREPKDLFIDVLIGLPELADGTATVFGAEAIEAGDPEGEILEEVLEALRRRRREGGRR